MRLIHATIVLECIPNALASASPAGPPPTIKTSDSSQLAAFSAVDMFRPACNSVEDRPFLLARLKTLELVERNDIKKQRGAACAELDYIIRCRV